MIATKLYLPMFHFEFHIKDKTCHSNYHVQKNLFVQMFNSTKDD